MKTLTTPPPSDRREHVETLSTGKVRIDKYLAPVLEMLQDLPLVDRAKIVGISKKGIYELFKSEYENQCEVAHQYLKSRWEWRDTGDPVIIDEDFLNEFFQVEIKKQSLYKQLRERRAEFDLVYDIVNEFENSDVYRKVD